MNRDKNELRSAEELRRELALWLLHHNKNLLFYTASPLGDEFVRDYSVDESELKLFNISVDENDRITVVFTGRVSLSTELSLSGKAECFIFHKYVDFAYDENGDITGQTVLGYFW